MRNASKHIALFLIIAAAGMPSGCGKNTRNNSAQAAHADKLTAGATIGERVQHKISRQVLTGIPEKGSLKDIRKRGILKVALPPPQPPFQIYIKELRAPSGFNVALAGEFARILEVKPNFTFMPRKKAAAGKMPSMETFDIYFMEHGSRNCPAGRSIKYFFAGPDDGWLSICIPGKDRELFNAFKNTLFYMTETGIYSQLYADYFE